jgi:autotransporter-associated beta strand protein
MCAEMTKWFKRGLVFLQIGLFIFPKDGYIQRWSRRSMQMNREGCQRTTINKGYEMNKKRTGRFIALALLLAGLCSTAQAANRIWNGGTDANWATTNNWSAAIAGHTAVFTNLGAFTTLNNDITGLTLAGITFANNSYAYTINGNTITLGGNIAVNTNAQVINLPMTLNADRTATVKENATLTLGGPISGAFGLTKTSGAGNGGTLILTGANTFTGDLTLGAGIIKVSSDENMGAGANLNHAQNAKLTTTTSFGISKTITLNAVGQSQDFVPDAGTTLTLNGKITGGNGGTATMRIAGDGTVVYAAENDHGASTTVTGGGLLQISGAGKLNNGSANVGLNGSRLDLGNTAQMIGALNFVGGASFVSNGNLTVNSITNGAFTNGIATVSANLHGAGATLLQKQGTLILNGINDFTGATTVTSTGTTSKLVVNGSTLSDITVGSLGALGGSGTVHAVTVNAGGVLSAANTNSLGALTFTADASLEAGSTNIIKIYSTSLYDVLKGSVSNTLTLAGQNIIDFTGWTTPGVANGTTFALFQNWSSINTTGGTFTFVNPGNLGLTDDQILVATGNGFAVSSKSAPNILLLY